MDNLGTIPHNGMHSFDVLCLAGRKQVKRTYSIVAWGEGGAHTLKRKEDTLTEKWI
jgi:hypothetical protein